MWCALLVMVVQSLKNRKDFQPEYKLDMFHGSFHPRDDESLVKGKRESKRCKRLPVISLAQIGCHGPKRLTSNSSLLLIVRAKKTSGIL
jgi:hypothetical protein